MFLLLKTIPQDAVYNSEQCFLKSVSRYFSQFPFSFSSSYQIFTWHQAQDFFLLLWPVSYAGSTPTLPLLPAHLRAPKLFLVTSSPPGLMLTAHLPSEACAPGLSTACHRLAEEVWPRSISGWKSVHFSHCIGRFRNGP